MANGGANDKRILWQYASRPALDRKHGAVCDARERERRNFGSFQALGASRRICQKRYQRKPINMWSLWQSPKNG